MQRETERYLDLINQRNQSPLQRYFINDAGSTLLLSSTTGSRKVHTGLLSLTTVLGSGYYLSEVISGTASLTFTLGAPLLLSGCIYLDNYRLLCNVTSS